MDEQKPQPYPMVGLFFIEVEAEKNIEYRMKNIEYRSAS